MIIVVGIAALIVGLLLSWYYVWQWEEVPIGKKIYQLRQGWLMYIGDMDNYGAIYYDGKVSLKFHMRGFWSTYKTIEDNETLMHLKGMYTYGYEWKDIWLIWSKDYGNAVEVVKAAKFDVDYCFNHAGAHEICNIFLWLRNIREKITDKVVDYRPFTVYNYEKP